ncbi:MAG: DNA polymerase III subunit gamma/tau [Oscillospiraceae bacterium]
MYRALYRKWRPLKFADVVGQTSIITALQNQILHNKVGHAYIFTGTRGTGKTTCAKIFAKAVNCLNKTDANPCGECAICKGIDNGSVLDVVEIDAASNNGIDNIRDLRDETAYTPSECTYKVYIIDEVHMLSTAAFNALLKIMEEPPSHIIFILATTEIHKVPATILSRCQRYDFTRISVDDIQKRLEYVAQQENLQLTSDAAALISRLADGAMRDALSILDTCAGVTDIIDEDTVRRMAGVTDKSYLFDMSSAIQIKDIAKAMLLIAQLREKSIDIKRLCEELLFHYRNILLSGIDGGKGLLSGVSEQDEQLYMQSSKDINQHDAIRAVKILGEALDRMGKGTDARIELELALFDLCAEETQPLAVPIKPAVSGASASYEVQQSSASMPFNAMPVVNNAPAINVAPVVNTAPIPKVNETQKAIPFTQWQQVIDAMEAQDKCLFVNMSNSKAYFDGARVLIEASDLFSEYMRTNDYSKTLIRNTIEQITGKRYALGPYKSTNTIKTESVTAEDSLNDLSAKGVEVIIN